MQVHARGLAIGIAIAPFITGIHAFWRMECRAQSGMARVDPLVDYGQPSAHVHHVFGGNGKFQIPNSINLSSVIY